MLTSNKFHDCKAAAGERLRESNPLERENQRVFQVAGTPEGRLGSGAQTPTAGVYVCLPPGIQQGPTARLCPVGYVSSLQGLVPGNARRDVHQDCPRCLWGWQRDTEMLLYG